MKEKIINYLTSSCNLIFAIGFFVRRIIFGSWIAGYSTDDLPMVVEAGWINPMSFFAIIAGVSLFFIFLNIISTSHSRKSISLILLYILNAVIIALLHVIVNHLGIMIEKNVLEIITAVLIILLFVVNIIQMILITISKELEGNKRIRNEGSVIFISVILLIVYSYASIVYTKQAIKIKEEESKYYENVEDTEIQEYRTLQEILDNN